MNKHTPGPWIVVEQYGELTVRSANERDTKDHTYLEISSEIGGLRTGDKCENHSEEVANAYLIAAAPDLMEALIWVRDSPEESAYWLKKVGNAIAKATGESA